MAQFTRFKPTRDAMLFGWCILGEDFLSDATPGANGGGGFCAQMSDVFFQRYDASYQPQDAKSHYAPRYKPTRTSGRYTPRREPAAPVARYKPTLRKQKGH